MRVQSVVGTGLRIVLGLAAITAAAAADVKVVDLTFDTPPGSGFDNSRTLESLKKVQGTGGLHQDALYLMTHFGDREAMFRQENQRAIDTPWRADTWRYCSVFSVARDESAILGRNWDNQNVGSIIISFCHPPGGYASVSFSRAIDLGYPLNLDLEQIKSTPLGEKLLLAPFYSVDGINEHGLAVAVAGVRETTRTPQEGDHLVFVTFLIRKILDQTKTVDEAVALARTVTPFDLDKSSVNSHLILADASGNSAILEFEQGGWKITYGKGVSQVLTNKMVYRASEASLREACWRYKAISEALDTAQGGVDWQTGLSLLNDAHQQGTTWSVVYSLHERELYFSVYQDWATVYHLRIP